jgi:hypothetical protein
MRLSAPAPIQAQAAFPVQTHAVFQARALRLWSDSPPTPRRVSGRASRLAFVTSLSLRYCSSSQHRLMYCYTTIDRCFSF